ncbi:MAG: hypothetical protein M9962_00880 [Oligoflexia bacterium]|nr:hypothetical protein [Oligoflexia bacterium]
MKNPKIINKNYLHIAVISISALAFTACGNGPIDKISESTTQSSQNDMSATNFVTNASLRINPLSPGEAVEEASAKSSFELAAGTGVAILETKVDPTYGTIVRLGIDAEEDSGMPTDVWVKLDEVKDILVPESDENPANTAEDPEGDALLNILSDEEAGYSENSDQDDLSQYGIEEVAKKKKKGKKKMTYCYRYVKQYLLKKKLVKVYLPGVNARDAAKILPKHGFKKTGHTPRTAKNGEVCVYTGGCCGHIEVKINGKFWYGYGYKDKPINELLPRPFLGCFTK